MAVQLPLQFEFSRQQNFSSFYPGNNLESVAHVQGFLNHPDHQQIYLWGPAGLGKTHLLQACCLNASEQQRDAFYLGLKNQPMPPFSILEGLEHIELVCIDDIHLIAGIPEWEESIFRFYNAQRQNHHKVIFSSTQAVNDMTVCLPDLKTRLSWGLSLKLSGLDDDQILMALNFKAKQMGFSIPDNVGQYLLSRYERNLPSLWQTLDKIDQTTLASKRKLTIPLLKQIMAETHAG